MRIIDYELTPICRSLTSSLTPNILFFMLPFNYFSTSLEFFIELFISPCIIYSWCLSVYYYWFPNVNFSQFSSDRIYRSTTSSTYFIAYLLSSFFVYSLIFCWSCLNYSGRGYFWFGSLRVNYLFLFTRAFISLSLLNKLEC